ncbi:MAG: Gfo/Idh/MocA family oxidoreductase [Actinomycetaceae bacterium]|nr:Gfo/Idh/MocA family oxidoreductase [Actinomycetaceae bacterium]
MPNPHENLPQLPPVMRALAGLEPTWPHALDPMSAPAKRWGILGAGHIAGTFARDISAYTRQEIVAVASRDLAKSKQFAADNGVDPAGAYGSYEDLAADPRVDIVYVATTHNVHLQTALTAIEGGKHVLIEKAFTRTAAEAKQIFDAARANGVFAMEAMWTRFLPGQVLSRRLVETGAIGPLVAAEADHGQSLEHVERLMNPDFAGGALLDLGVYPISFLYSYLGKPARVLAAGRLTPTNVDAGNVTVLDYGQALAVARSDLDGRSSTGASLTGREGCLEFPRQFYRPSSVRLRLFSEGAAEKARSLVSGEDFELGQVAASDRKTEGIAWEWDATVPGGFQYQVAEVARCVDAGQRESSTTTWQNTLDVMEIMDQARTHIGGAY